MSKLNASLIWVLGWLLTVFLIVSPARAAPNLPPDFTDTLVTKVNGPTGLAFTPDGRLLATSQFGTLHVYKDGTQTQALNLTSKICSDKERGLLGAAVDPSFTGNRFIYLYYTFKKLGTCEYNTVNSPVNRVSRFILGDNNVVNPASEVVLVDNIPSPDGIHNAGDLKFGKDGFLYASVGDGGCDYAGDSGCGGVNNAARDQHILLGKILRITRDGDIPPTNPFQGTDSARCNLAGRTDPGKKCQETYSWGLRNPFRIAFDPNAAGTRFFINDVGQGTWEEIDLGQAGADFGWSVREGHCAQGSTTDCGPPPAGMTNPIYDYPHSSGCTGITAGAFVPNGIWPQSYDNTYLYGDFVCGKIIRLMPTPGGGFTANDFVTGLQTNSIISMIFGPFGTTQALYYMNYLNGGEVRRVAFTGTANRAPTAHLVANPTSGNAPLTVHFDGTGSSDPDNDPLSYDWDFGDGSAHSSSSAPSHTYTSAGTFTATLRVSDNRGGQDSATVRIDPGNTAPVPRIDSPAPTKRFAVGEVVTLHGSATDAQDGPLPESALRWTVIKHHDTHTHPFLPPTTGNDIPIAGPDPEDPAATTTTFLEIQLTATDSQGLSSTITQELRPNLVDVTFATSPTGLQLEVNASTITAPRTIVSWQAWHLAVKAPDQSDPAGRPMAFSAWSDGGAAAHTIITPSSPVTYTATYRQLGALLFSDGFESGGLAAWTGVSGLAVQQQEVFAGAYAARQTSTGTATFAYKQLSAPQPDVYYRLRFKVLSQGANNVTLGKFLTATGSSILAFYRASNGTLGLRNDVQGATSSSSTVAQSGVWHELLVRVRVGAAGLTEVWLDGMRVSELDTTQPLGTTPIGRVQLGNNQTGRTYDVAHDDVAISEAISAYPRPASATPLRVPLVPAYARCSSPDRTHVSPLAFPSCSSPTQESAVLTTSSAGHGSGFAQLSALLGDPATQADDADVRLSARATDVRCRATNTACPGGPGSDYAGRILARLLIRVTDGNSTGGRPGTVQDTRLDAPLTCSATVETGLGSTCAVTTTADTLMPGFAVEGKRTVIETLGVSVLDPGPNGSGFASCPPGCGDGDERVFLDQGVFTP